MLPQCIDDVIADLAVVFHWTPSDVADMHIDELMQWHDRARKRSESDKK